MIRYNPPYSRNVKTNIGGRFLALIKKYFPHSRSLEKYLQKKHHRNQPQLHAKIWLHASKATTKRFSTLQRKKRKSPATAETSHLVHSTVNAKPQSWSIIIAFITSGPTKKEYTGMSAPPFKSRHANHMTTTRYEKYSSSTEFSNYIWNLKKSNAQYEVQWRIKDRARAYSNITKRCSLCTREKYHILNMLGSPSRLSKRSEMMSKCWHENKYLLKYHGVT